MRLHPTSMKTVRRTLAVALLLLSMAVFPVTAASVNPPNQSPCLEYRVLIAEAGEVNVDVITGIAMNNQPGCGVRFAVSFDDQAPVICDAFEGQFHENPEQRSDTSSPAVRNWYEWVQNNARTLTSKHRVDTAGVHTLKIWMVDPGVVLEKIIVHRDGYPSSYFGPPEIMRQSKP